MWVWKSAIIGSLFAYLVIIGAFVCLPAAPSKASFNSPAAISLSTTAGAASAQILPAEAYRRYLLIENVCSVNIGISIGGAAAAIGTAGTVTLFPGGSMEFKADYVPQNAFNAISSSGTCGVTIWEIF